MKYIIAIIQPDRLEDVLAKLDEKEIHLVTVDTVLGRGRQKGISEVYRSHKEVGSLLRKAKLEIAVNDEYQEKAVQAILDSARSSEQGEIGDGKIFIFELKECVRIRTGEKDTIAIG